MGNIRNKMIEEFLSTDIQVGEPVSFKTEVEDWVYNKKKKSEMVKSVKEFGFMHSSVVSVDKENQTVKVKVFNRDYKFEKDIPMSEITRDVRRIGVIPAPLKEDSWNKRCRVTGLSLNFLISMLKEERKNFLHKDDENYPDELNFNPYIIDKDGKKIYYQRDYCWSVEDEQLFIESIYNDLDCGKIVLRKNDISKVFDAKENGENDVCFYDVIDGKQRLNTLRRFINDEFCDLHGNYWSDFSVWAQRNFEEKNCITILEMETGATDKDVIKVFLNVNFSGKPMSKEHIDFVRGLYDNI